MASLGAVRFGSHAGDLAAADHDVRATGELFAEALARSSASDAETATRRERASGERSSEWKLSNGLPEHFEGADSGAVCVGAQDSSTHHACG